MRTVRKLATVLACTALLAVVGATTAGAEPAAKCDQFAKISVAQNHKAKFESRLQDKLRALQVRCSG